MYLDTELAMASKRKLRCNVTPWTATRSPSILLCSSPDATSLLSRQLKLVSLHFRFRFPNRKLPPTESAASSSNCSNRLLELQLPNDYCYSATLLYTAKCRAHTLNLDSQQTQRIQSSFRYSFSDWLVHSTVIVFFVAQSPVVFLVITLS